MIATMLRIILVAAAFSSSSSLLTPKQMCYLLNCFPPTKCTIKEIKCGEDNCPKMAFCAKDLAEKILGISDCNMVRCSEGYTCITSLQLCIRGMCDLAVCVPTDEARYYGIPPENVDQNEYTGMAENSSIRNKTFELDYLTSVPLVRNPWRKSLLTGQPPVEGYSADFFGNRFTVPLDTLDKKTADFRRMSSSLDYLILLKQLRDANTKAKKNKKGHGFQKDHTPECKGNTCNVVRNLRSTQSNDFLDKLFSDDVLLGSDSILSDDSVLIYTISSVLNNTTGSVLNNNTDSVLKNTTDSVLNNNTDSVLKNTTDSVLNNNTDSVLNNNTDSVLKDTTNSVNDSKDNKEFGDKKSKHCCGHCCPDCKNSTQTPTAPSMNESLSDSVNSSHCCHSEKSHTKCNHTVNPNQLPDGQSNITMGDTMIPAGDNDSENGSKSVESTQGHHCHEKVPKCCSATDLKAASANDAQLLNKNQEVPVPSSSVGDIIQTQEDVDHKSGLKTETVAETVNEEVNIETLNTSETEQFSQNESLNDQEINIDQNVGHTDLHKEVLVTGLDQKYQTTGIQSRNSPDSSLFRVKNRTELCIDSQDSKCHVVSSEDVESGTVLEETLNEFNRSMFDTVFSGGHKKLNNPLPEKSSQSLPASILSTLYSFEKILSKSNLTSDEDYADGNDSVLRCFEFMTVECLDCSNETRDGTNSTYGLQNNANETSELASYSQFNECSEILKMFKKQLKKSKSDLPKKFEQQERFG